MAANGGVINISSSSSMKRGSALASSKVASYQHRAHRGVATAASYMASRIIKAAASW